jgi:hypothetical protein
MIVEKMTQLDEGFWALMGPFFASAKVKRDLGVAMSSDENYKWILAFLKGQVVGFVTIVPGKDCEHVKHLYSVDSDHAVLTNLLKAATKTNPLKLAIVAPEELPIWEAHGFSKTGKTKGRYFEVKYG